MNPYIEEPVWRKCFEGWSISDCALRDRNIMYLCLRKDVSAEEASMLWDSEIPTTLIDIYLESPEENLVAEEFSGLANPILGVSNKPVAHGLMVVKSASGYVVPVGADDPPMENIHENGFPMPHRIKTLNGYAYSVGLRRRIYKRVAPGQWEKLKGLPDGGDVAAVGFRDLDAFADDDMYAVGGHGDVWHFDGHSWHQKSFPTNVQLGTVTCAGDGNVYITGEGGAIWVGRDSTWKRLHAGASTILWNDALWFEDKLWLASDYHFRVWNGQSLELPLGPNGKPVVTCGHMDVRDGLLAIASTDTVLTFDGTDWRVIVAPYK